MKRYFTQLLPTMVKARFNIERRPILCHTENACFSYSHTFQKWYRDRLAWEIYVNQSYYELEEVGRLYLVIRGIPECDVS